MKALWAPWRQPFVMRSPGKGCLFCKARRSRDDKRAWVVHRGKYAMVMLNLYPYNNGHIMVVPYRHVSKFSRLKDNELLEIWRLVERFMKKLDQKIHPHGYNVGLNLGRVAGAGVPGHMHVHIVPRWNADTNMMPVIGQTKVISASLQSLYRMLKK